MYVMQINFSDFVDWLESEVDAGRLTQADIANTGLVGRSAVSLLFSRTTKSLSFEMCEAIAIATKLPLEEIYRKAGLLPSVPTDNDELDKRILNLAKSLPVSEKEKFVKRLELETQFYEPQRPTRPANKPRS
jgi:hypothetical protein